ncbi:sodium-dependent noradrenaline transporter-like [Diadema antillarum]|uniref:sodium-dependent noradrenaline transporter-like n=1 Tax=Diadema antillarum TaxID=105358 RepID=UPI003A845D5E
MRYEGEDVRGSSGRGRVLQRAPIPGPETSPSSRPEPRGVPSGRAPWKCFNLYLGVSHTSSRVISVPSETYSPLILDLSSSCCHTGSSWRLSSLFLQVRRPPTMDASPVANGVPLTEDFADGSRTPKSSLTLNNPAAVVDVGIDNPTVDLEEDEKAISVHIVKPEDTDALPVVNHDLVMHNNNIKKDGYAIHVDPSSAKLLDRKNKKVVEVELEDRNRPEEDGIIYRNEKDDDDGLPEKAEEEEEEERETWGRKIDFLLSVIGFSVDLANVWRFPYFCYRNGGGAFLIPYVIFLFIGGIPLLYMELSLGQYHRAGAISVWKICPLFQGVGWAVVLMAWYVGFYYNVVIAWSFYYLFASFTKLLPWTFCGNTWNTEWCFDETMNATWKEVEGELMWHNASTGSTPATEYFDREMLRRHESSGLFDLAGLSWQLPLCLLLVMIILYFSIWKGVKTSGKVVWVTATLPYFVLTILLIRGATLPGAGTGIKFYLLPDFNQLANAQVWIDAAVQIFYSIGAGFGVHIAFASYNKFHSNVYRDAIFTSCTNCFTSFFSGFAVFSILGYLAEKTQKDISEVATEGPGLVFTVYPEAIATLPGAPFWSVIFYIMLITLGLDSSFGGTEAIITGLVDMYPRIFKKRRELLVLAVVISFFLFGLIDVTYGGIYVFHLESEFAASASILFAVAIEVIAVSWFYGVNRFAHEIKEMIGFMPSYAWRICWKFVSPTFILAMFFASLVLTQPLVYEEYVYPHWGNVLAWLLAASSMVLVPIVAVWQVIKAPGSGFKEKFAYAITPRSDYKLISEKREISRYTAKHWRTI